MRTTRFFMLAGALFVAALVACGADDPSTDSDAPADGATHANTTSVDDGSDSDAASGAGPAHGARGADAQGHGVDGGGRGHGDRQPNRLVHEKSPYLLQHAYNPVHWYPWGEEAFARARAEQKPVFLSIGYSTCHWCHVMERESFEDDDIAAVMNERYIAIKVDREERPDVDKVYMNAAQAMNQRGGWPLSAWLTPDGKPFFTGTYFPPDDRYGRPGFRSLLVFFSDMWQSNPDTLRLTGDAVTAYMERQMRATAAVELDASTFDVAAGQLSDRFDADWGGFGAAPKFPRTHTSSFLLRHWKRTGDRRSLEMVESTLDFMARGGMADHLGGGFHRYSVDREWLVPHFEKMLYDQALIALTYLEAYQATGRQDYADVVHGTFEYILRDMLDPGGAFHAAEDADSEGEEGVFYVWRPEQINDALGPELGELFNSVYGVTESGNFEHATSILHLTKPLADTAAELGRDPDELAAELKEARDILLGVRSTRIRPHLDDKIITAWNGMMISAFAQGAQILDEPRYAEAAARAADFILEHMRNDDGVLLRRYRDNEAAFTGFIDDYAFFTNALVDAYQATFEPRYLDTAVTLARDMIELFWDEEHGGFSFQGEANEELLVNTREVYDGARPSGNSIAALALLRLGHLTGDPELEARGHEVIRAFSAQLSRAPSGYTQMLVALDFAIGPTLEVVIAGEPGAVDTQRMLEAIHGRFVPNKVLALRPRGPVGAAIAELAPFLSEQHPIDGRATAYVCRNHACSLPTPDPAEMLALIENAGAASND